MIYSITIVTVQGVKTYTIGQVLTGNKKKINQILSSNVGEFIIYQVLDNKGKLLVEIVNCPVEVIYV